MFKKGSRLSGILPALATVDIIGSILFIFGVGLIILATAWGGATYSWSAPQVLAPLVVGSICFVLFFVYEYFLEPGRIFARIFPKQVAMLPYSMFARRDTIWLAIVQFSTGAGKHFHRSQKVHKYSDFHSNVLHILLHRNLLLPSRSLPSLKSRRAVTILHPRNGRYVSTHQPDPLYPFPND